MGIGKSESKISEILLSTYSEHPAKYVDSGDDIDNDVELEFLLRLVAVSQPLAIQVHPNKSQAEDGFVKENVANVHRNAFHRNYKDDNRKVKTIFTLSESFKLLYGFREIAKSIECLEKIIEQAEHSTDLKNLNSYKELLLKTKPEDIPQVVEYLLSTNSGVELSIAITNSLSKVHNDKTVSSDLKGLIFIASNYPNDVGLPIALLMNSSTVEKHTAIIIKPNTPYCYVEGAAVEVASTSDNVIRGGLTNKFIDEVEFVKTIESKVASLNDEFIIPKESLKYYEGAKDFTLIVESNGTVDLSGKNTVGVALENSSLECGEGELTLKMGESFLLTREDKVTVKGLVLFAR